MRNALLAAAVLLLLPLAGCSGSTGSGQQDEAGDDDRRSVGGGSGGNDTGDPPHDTVTVLDETVDLVGDASVTFDVTVPANVTNVDFKITYGSAGAVFNDLRIELSGCGAYGTGGASIGTVTLAGRLCKDAASGPATLTVSNTGLVQDGSLQITAQIPRPVDNATTSSGTATGNAFR